MSLNNVSLMGRMCFEPELRSTNSGVSVLRFTIAVDRNYTPNGQERQADFIDCVAWRNTAEFIKRYFHKGSMIALTGELQTQNYTDKDGKQRKTVEVVANNVSFCGAKEKPTEANTDGDKTNLNIAPEDDYEPIDDDTSDLPF